MSEPPRRRAWFKKKPTASALASSALKSDASKSTFPQSDGGSGDGGGPVGASFESREFSLTLHGLDFSDQDVVINPELFPEVKLDDILELYVQGSPAPAAILRVRSLAPVKGHALSISVSNSMAELFHLHRGAVVTVKFADQATVGLQRATLAFKDYVSRSEMWRLKTGARALLIAFITSVPNVYDDAMLLCSRVGPDSVPGQVHYVWLSRRPRQRSGTSP